MGNTAKGLDSIGVLQYHMVYIYIYIFVQNRKCSAYSSSSLFDLVHGPEFTRFDSLGSWRLLLVGVRNEWMIQVVQGSTVLELI